MNSMTFSKRKKKVSKRSLKHQRAKSYGNGSFMVQEDERSISDSNSDSEEIAPRRGSKKFSRSMRGHRRNKSVGGNHLSVYRSTGKAGTLTPGANRKKLSFDMRKRTISLLELEKLEIEKRIMMI